MGEPRKMRPRVPVEEAVFGNVAVEASTAHGARIAAWAKHQFAQEAFRLVHETLRGGNVDVLPVKGIVLAYRLYDSVDERPMVDVDLRVRPCDLPRVVELARACDWRVRRTSRQLGTIELFLKRTLVEFETSVGSPGVCAIGIDEMMARSDWQTGELGVLHREPEIHDHALLLCVNAFKDKLVLAAPWARRDLLRIAQMPNFSANQLAARARDAKLRTLVAVVADWLTRESDAPRWEEVRAAVGELQRTRYVALYRALVARAPKSAAMAAVARAASDVGSRQVAALAMGFAGTVAAQVARWREPAE